MYVGLTADPLVMQVFKETIKSNNNNNNSIEIRIMVLVYLVSKSYRSTQKMRRKSKVLQF